MQWMAQQLAAAPEIGPVDTPELAAQQFLKYGVAVCKLDSITPLELHVGLTSARKSFPEYKQTVRDSIGTPNEQRMVLGGFGALANPSSFHHPFVRRLRKLARTKVTEIMVGVLPNVHDWYIQALFDRIGVRKKEFGTPTAEAWHRDIYSGANGGDERHENDIILGGWINCDFDTTQTFNCVPATATTNPMRSIDPNFHVQHLVDPEFVDLLEATTEEGFTLLRSPSAVERLERAKRSIQIPPGHMIIFYQDILHEVVSKTPPPVASTRLYVGHALRTVNRPLYDYTENINSQGVPPIPSGQIPPLFSVNHYAFFKKPGTIFAEWNPFVMPPVQNKYNGHLPQINPSTRSMLSLQEYGLPKYPDYTAEDREIVSIVSIGQAAATDVEMA